MFRPMSKSRVIAQAEGMLYLALKSKIKVSVYTEMPFKGKYWDGFRDRLQASINHYLDKANIFLDTTDYSDSFYTFPKYSVLQLRVLLFILNGGKNVS